MLPTVSASVSPDDEVFHAAGDDPHWIETIWTSFEIPERAVNGWIYVWPDARSGISGGGLAVWDRSGSGSTPYTCMIE
jgi:hypothetical protein